MTIINNASISLNKVVPEEARRKLEDAGLIDTSDSSVDVIYIYTNHPLEKPAHDVIEISDCGGDLTDELNQIVEILKPYGISPLVGESNHYYGDYDGYDVFTGEKFVSMDVDDYAIYAAPPDILIRRLEELGYTVTKK